MDSDVRMCSSEIAALHFLFCFAVPIVSLRLLVFLWLLWIRSPYADMISRVVILQSTRPTLSVASGAMQLQTNVWRNRLNEMQVNIGIRLYFYEWPFLSMTCGIFCDYYYSCPPSSHIQTLAYHFFQIVMAICFLRLLLHLLFSECDLRQKHRKIFFWSTIDDICRLTVPCRTMRSVHVKGLNFHYLHIPLRRTCVLPCVALLEMKAKKLEYLHRWRSLIRSSYRPRHRPVASSIRARSMRDQAASPMPPTAVRFLFLCLYF